MKEFGFLLIALALLPKKFWDPDPVIPLPLFDTVPDYAQLYTTLTPAEQAQIDEFLGKFKFGNGW